MTSVENLSAAELAVQLQQHLASLHAAGVQWLPASAPLPAGLIAAPRPALDKFAPAPQTPVQSRPGPSPSAGSPPTGPALYAAASPAPVAPELPLEERRRELRVLADRVAGCTRCSELVATRKQTVFGVGPFDPELCFVGEAPGFNEDQQGEPFVGDAGQLLNRIIAACGMKREQVYICNTVKCRPPGNRLPLPDEAAHCREYLVRQLELIRPKFLCALGACAAQNLLQTTQSVGRLRGRFHDYRGIPVLCTYHPAYLLRTPQKKKEVWEDMQVLLAKMGKPVPRK